MKTFSSAELMGTSVQMAVHFLWTPLNINSFCSLFLDNISSWTPTRVKRDRSIFNFYHRVKFIPSAIRAAETNEFCRSADFLQLLVLLKLMKYLVVLISFSYLYC